MSIMYYIFLGILSFVVGWLLASKEDTKKPIDSELSNPKVNIPEVGFGRPHMQILDVLLKNDPNEVTRSHINITLGKSTHHAYERQLWLWGMVNRRAVKNPSFEKGWIHYYTLTPRGKETLLQFKDKFYHETGKTHS